MPSAGTAYLITQSTREKEKRSHAQLAPRAAAAGTLRYTSFIPRHPTR